VLVEPVVIVNVHTVLAVTVFETAGAVLGLTIVIVDAVVSFMMT
jgi:hypothetical protein